MDTKLLKLLKEKEERKAYEMSIIELLKTGYELIDKKNAVTRESATARHVYAYLAKKLNVINSWKFQIQISNILVKNGVIERRSYKGIIWFRGIVGQQEDKLVVDKILSQHYKDRKLYRARLVENSTQH